jgi:hypothetical protein
MLVTDFLDRKELKPPVRHPLSGRDLLVSGLRLSN